MAVSPVVTFAKPISTVLIELSSSSPIKAALTTSTPLSMVHHSSTTLDELTLPTLPGMTAASLLWLSGSLSRNFIAEILKKDKKAHVIAAGDFNEFAAVAPLQTFVKTSGLVDVDEAAKIPETERYTYLFDSNCQALDHMYISKELRRSIKYEHLHINTWQNTAGEVSDHDPSVAMFDLC
ncbi:hypothetical protein LB505_001406 [Fusarium chuoi]|nr:hypothetical protein LB505_001406 [Fusarium chuoi]